MLPKKERPTAKFTKFRPINVTDDFEGYNLSEWKGIRGASGCPIFNSKGLLVGIYGLGYKNQTNAIELGLTDASNTGGTCINPILDVNSLEVWSAREGNLSSPKHVFTTAVENLINDNNPKRTHYLLVAATGTGKSSEFPKQLALRMKPGETIIILQPNVVACRSGYARLCHILELDQKAKARSEFTISYKVGWRNTDNYEKMGEGPKRIEFKTYGLFINTLTGAGLKGKGYILMDECHDVNDECVVATDLYLLSGGKANYKVVHVTATKRQGDVGFPISDYVAAETLYPIDCEHALVDVSEPDPIYYRIKIGHNRYVGAVKEIVKDGVTLCFMASRNGVERAAKAFKEDNPDYPGKASFVHAGCKWTPDMVGANEIVFATDTIGKSITIRHARTVLDLGTELKPTCKLYKNDAGIYYRNSLDERTIDKDTAMQRKGRVGRTEKGYYMQYRSPVDEHPIDVGTLAMAMLRLCSINQFDIEHIKEQYYDLNIIARLESLLWLRPLSIARLPEIMCVRDIERNHKQTGSRDQTEVEWDWAEKLKHCLDGNGDSIYLYINPTFSDQMEEHFISGTFKTITGSIDSDRRYLEMYKRFVLCMETTAECKTILQNASIDISSVGYDADLLQDDKLARELGIEILNRQRVNISPTKKPAKKAELAKVLEEPEEDELAYFDRSIEAVNRKKEQLAKYERFIDRYNETIKIGGIIEEDIMKKYHAYKGYVADLKKEIAKLGDGTRPHELEGFNLYEARRQRAMHNYLTYAPTEEPHSLKRYLTINGVKTRVTEEVYQRDLELKDQACGGYEPEEELHSNGLLIGGGIVSATVLSWAVYWVADNKCTRHTVKAWNIPKDQVLNACVDFYRGNKTPEEIRIQQSLYDRIVQWTNENIEYVWCKIKSLSRFFPGNEKAEKHSFQAGFLQYMDKAAWVIAGLATSLAVPANTFLAGVFGGAGFGLIYERMIATVGKSMTLMLLFGSHTVITALYGLNFGLAVAVTGFFAHLIKNLFCKKEESKHYLDFKVDDTVNNTWNLLITCALSSGLGALCRTPQYVAAGIAVRGSISAVAVQSQTALMSYGNGFIFATNLYKVFVALSEGECGGDVIPGLAGAIINAAHMNLSGAVVATATGIILAGIRWAVKKTEWFEGRNYTKKDGLDFHQSFFKNFDEVALSIMCGASVLLNPQSIISIIIGGLSGWVLNTEEDVDVKEIWKKAFLNYAGVDVVTTIVLQVFNISGALLNAMNTDGSELHSMGAFVGIASALSSVASLAWLATMDLSSVKHGAKRFFQSFKNGLAWIWENVIKAAWYWFAGLFKNASKVAGKEAAKGALETIKQNTNSVIGSIIIERCTEEDSETPDTVSVASESVNNMVEELSTFVDENIEENIKVEKFTREFAYSMVSRMHFATKKAARVNFGRIPCYRAKIAYDQYGYTGFYEVVVDIPVREFKLTSIQIASVMSLLVPEKYLDEEHVESNVRIFGMDVTLGISGGYDEKVFNYLVGMMDMYVWVVGKQHGTNQTLVTCVLMGFPDDLFKKVLDESDKIHPLLKVLQGVKKTTFEQFDKEFGIACKLTTNGMATKDGGISFMKRMYNNAKLKGKWLITKAMTCKFNINEYCLDGRISNVGHAHFDPSVYYSRIYDMQRSFVLDAKPDIDTFVDLKKNLPFGVANRFERKWICVEQGSPSGGNRLSGLVINDINKSAFWSNFENVKPEKVKRQWKISFESLASAKAGLEHYAFYSGVHTTLKWNNRTHYCLTGGICCRLFVDNRGEAKFELKTNCKLHSQIPLTTLMYTEFVFDEFSTDEIIKDDKIGSDWRVRIDGLLKLEDLEANTSPVKHESKSGNISRIKSFISDTKTKISDALSDDVSPETAILHSSGMLDLVKAYFNISKSDFDIAKIVREDLNSTVVENTRKIVEEVSPKNESEPTPLVYEEDDTGRLVKATADPFPYLCGFIKPNIGEPRNWKWAPRYANFDEQLYPMTVDDVNSINMRCNQLARRVRLTKKEWYKIRSSERVFFEMRMDKASRGSMKMKQFIESSFDDFSNAKYILDPTCGLGGFEYEFCERFKKSTDKTIFVSTLFEPGHQVLDSMGLPKNSSVRVVPVTTVEHPDRGNVCDIRCRRRLVKVGQAIEGYDFLWWDAGEFSDDGKKNRNFWLHIPTGGEKPQNLLNSLVEVMENSLRKGAKAMIKINGVFDDVEIVVEKLSRKFRFARAMKVGTAHHFTPEWYLFLKGFQPEYTGESIMRTRTICRMVMTQIYDALTTAVRILHVKGRGYKPIFRTDWTTYEVGGEMQSPVSSNKEPPGPTTLKIKGEYSQIDLRWEPNWKKRLNKIKEYGKNIGHKMYIHPDSSFKAEHLYVRGSMRRKIREPGNQDTANELLMEACGKAFKVDKTTLVMCQTSTTREWVEASRKKRLDMPKPKPDIRRLMKLADAFELSVSRFGRLIRGHGRFYNEEEILSMINKKGSVGALDPGNTLIEFCEVVPHWFDLVLKQTKMYEEGKPTHAYATCRPKREAKAKKNVENGKFIHKPVIRTRMTKEEISFENLSGREKVKTENDLEQLREEMESFNKQGFRWIQFYDALTRLTGYHILGWLIDMAGKQKIYKSTVNGCPPFKQGTVLRTIWDLNTPKNERIYHEGINNNSDVCVYWTKQGRERCTRDWDNDGKPYPKLGGFKQPCGASTDFSGLDGTVTIEERMIESEHFASFYPRQLRETIMNFLLEQSYSIVFDDEGNIWYVVGQRKSGEVTTSIGNTKLVQALINVAISESTGIPLRELYRTYAVVEYKTATKLSEKDELINGRPHVWKDICKYINDDQIEMFEEMGSNFDNSKTGLTVFGAIVSDGDNVESCNLTNVDNRCKSKFNCVVDLKGNKIEDIINYPTKWKVFEATAIPCFCDGDDTVIISTQEYIKRIDDSAKETLSMLCKAIRVGTKEGMQVCERFDQISFCSHTYEPVLIGKTANTVPFRPGTGGKELQEAYDRNQDLYSYKLWWLPVRPFTEILGKLCLTLKVRASKWNPDDTSPGGCVDVTTSKIMSYLLLYPHIRPIRRLCIALLSVTGDGTLEYSELMKRLNYSDIIGHCTTIGAIDSIYGVSSFDDIGCIPYHKDMEMLKINSYNVGLLGKSFTIKVHSWTRQLFNFACEKKVKFDTAFTWDSKLLKDWVEYINTTQNLTYFPKDDQIKAMLCQPQRNKVYAIVIPAGGGKTTLFKKFSHWNGIENNKKENKQIVFDIDDMLTQEQNFHLQDLKVEALRTGNWDQHNECYYGFLKINTKNLKDCIILCHDLSVVRELKWILTASFCPTINLHGENISNRNEFQKKIARENRKLVSSYASTKIFKTKDQLEQLFTRQCCQLFGFTKILSKADNVGLFNIVVPNEQVKELVMKILLMFISIEVLNRFVHLSVFKQDFDREYKKTIILYYSQKDWFSMNGDKMTWYTYFTCNEGHKYCISDNTLNLNFIRQLVSSDIRKELLLERNLKDKRGNITTPANQKEVVSRDNSILSKFAI
ncbi:MAG: polyprotein [Fushun laodelphax striatellus flavivirus 1]|nr:MAG: polyprotein [Fushun laodelphax striatellus flavivirus 1]